MINRIAPYPIHDCLTPNDLVTENPMRIILSSLPSPIDRQAVACSRRLAPSRAWLLLVALLPAGLTVCGAAQTKSPGGTATGRTREAGSRPTHLEVDSLTDPLGLDSTRPMLSWRLVDTRSGARQSAYQVAVYSRQPGSRTNQPDVWDSGRVESGISNGIAYGGPDLEPSKRYFWRVTVWDQQQRPYPASEVSWWETGLMQQSNWHAEWIGHEPEELHQVRGSGAVWITNTAATATEPHDTRHDFRYHFALDKPVQRAELYATGEDSAAAWINGRQVMEVQPLPAWQQMPWGTYGKVDVTTALQHGQNLLAIGVTKYKTPSGLSAPTRSPMSAVLYLVYKDGSTQWMTSSAQGWKAQLDAPEGWWQPTHADGGWKMAEAYAAPKDAFGSSDEGRPWPTGPVASLRKSFAVQPKAIASARLYATALGAYKFHLNGAVVGDQILSPGWMDFREHVPYQVYDVTAQVHHGLNAIAAYLAPGWYSTPLRWFRQGNNYGPTEPALKAQLRIAYADGSVDWVSTDGTWKADTSPILAAEIYDGETRDARREQAGWDTASFKDAAWVPATVVPAKEPRILAQYFSPFAKRG